MWPTRTTSLARTTSASRTSGRAGPGRPAWTSSATPKVRPSTENSEGPPGGGPSSVVRCIRALLGRLDEDVHEAALGTRSDNPDRRARLRDVHAVPGDLVATTRRLVGRFACDPPVLQVVETETPGNDGSTVG